MYIIVARFAFVEDAGGKKTAVHANGRDREIYSWQAERQVKVRTPGSAPVAEETSSSTSRPSSDDKRVAAAALGCGTEGGANDPDDFIEHQLEIIARRCGGRTAIFFDVIINTRIMA